MKVNGPCIDGELLNILSEYHETTDTPVYLQLIAALDLLKQNLVNVNGECYCVKCRYMKKLTLATRRYSPTTLVTIRLRH